MSDTPKCPECRAGKHGNCDETSWNEQTDQPDACPCHLDGHPDRALYDVIRDVTVAARREPTYGLCTACGSVEVALNRATGIRDLSGIGESATYPTGHGCEVCA